MVRIAAWIAFAIAGLATAQTKPAWKQARTPDGQPDLQGIWTNATITPLERPDNLAGKQFLTQSEAAALEKETVAGRVDKAPTAPGDVGGYNEFWFDRGTKVVPTRRTSMIVDPADGKIPPLTADGQKRAAARAEANRLHPADGPEDLRPQDRCILWPTAGPPMMPVGYNNYYQIVQTPGYVVILVEMIHDARIIPLGNGPLGNSAHPAGNIHEWKGDSRGHWEGNTLVVDTTNFNRQTHFQGSSEALHLIERFTRTDAETIHYEFKVDDPATFTRPWTAQLGMTKVKGPIYEYACSEGNYALADILAGERAAEKGR